MIGRALTDAALLAIFGAVATLGSCAGPADPPAPGAPAPGSSLPPPALPVRRELPPGTLLRLRPAEVVVEGAPFDTGFLDALMREALRLSPRFDVGADVEDGPSPFALSPRIDAAAGQLSITLDEDGAPPIPLATVRFDPGAIPAAVDRAAWAVRAGLGERATTAPPSIADLYSASPECVRYTERVLALDPGAGAGGALEGYLQRARTADPGCALTWNVFASWQLARGKPEEAARAAQTALSALTRRLSPTTAHRLARVLLLARARAAGTGQARPFDEQLLELGEASLAERPFDAHGRYTRALARNFLGQFTAAREDLAVLSTRWAEVPWVPYHIAFACLGTGDGPAALEAIETAARRLPFETVFMPHALALYAAGEHGELDELLVRALDRHGDATPFGHEVLRMRAALAVLRGHRDDAVTAILADFEWLRQRPSLLAGRAMDVAESGEVAVWLGAATLLPRPFEALREIPTLDASSTLALVFVEGLGAATAGELEIAQVALGTLERAQRDAWARRIRAATARRTGDVATEARELATSIRLDDSPLCRAAFARALRGLGRHEDADDLLADTREELLRVDLRLPLEHPLLSPGRALAFLATEPTPR